MAGHRAAILFNYDFLILDIELTRATGIDVGKYLRDKNRNFHTQIIYVSSKETYAMKLFSVQPLDFIVKPVKPEALIKAINRGFEIIGRSEDFFICKVGKENITISCKEILYFSSNKRVIKIVCCDEMIEYYSSLVKDAGGKVTAKWVYGMAVCGDYIYETYTWNKDEFYFVDEVSSIRNPGYPLDSMSIDKRVNKYFVELTDEDKEYIEKEKLKDGNKDSDVINFIVESLKK